MTSVLGEWDEPDVDLDDVDLAPGLDGEQPPDEGEEEPPPLYYPSVEAFVTELLAPTYRRSLGGLGVAWCPQWWRHAEAIARLEALWRAWEHLRLDAATGMSVWYRDHADHHMAVLLSADGPFKGCGPSGHREGRLDALPVDAPPPGLFRSEDAR